MSENGNEPWVSKYRPKKLEQVIYQKEVIQVLQKSLSNYSLPHLLFYGPPGTGKTSTIKAISRELFGPKLLKARVLELNASDERGINVVREKVKNFACVAVGSKPMNYQYPCPNFKIIILDEADNMTKDAQAALRRTMEKYTNVTRFCLICNYISKIIEPVTSRCAKFRYKPLDKKSVVGQLKRICKNEKVVLPKNADLVLEKIHDVSEGDLRKGITILQTSVRMLQKDDALSVEMIEEVAGLIPKNVITDVIKVCGGKDLKEVETIAKLCVRKGFSVRQIISQVHDVICYMNSNVLSDLGKSKICIKLAKVEKNLKDGGDEYVQLLETTSYMTKVFMQENNKSST